MPMSAMYPTCLFEICLKRRMLETNLGVVHFSVIHKICVIYAIIVDVNAVPSSVINVDGKYACSVMISIMTSATSIANASLRG